MIMAAKIGRREVRLAVKVADLSLATHTVIAARLARIGKRGAKPNRRTQAEIKKMSHEKVAAAAESWTAIAFSGARLGQQLMSLGMAAMWQPHRYPPADVAIRAAKLGYVALLDGSNAGIEPFRKRARSNARRLTKE
jgi:hypothetical protein